MALQWPGVRCRVADDRFLVAWHISTNDSTRTSRGSAIALTVVKNGVLTVLLPKSDDAKKREKKIELNKAQGRSVQPPWAVRACCDFANDFSGTGWHTPTKRRSLTPLILLTHGFGRFAWIGRKLKETGNR